MYPWKYMELLQDYFDAEENLNSGVIKSVL